MTNQDKEISIIHRQYQFIDQRPVLARYNNDPLAIVKLLQAEIDEFVEAYESEQPMEEVAREAADVIIFAITLFKTLEDVSIELDLEAEVHSKIARNEHKYPVGLFQKGFYPEMAAVAKKRWVQQGGDSVYYKRKKEHSS